MITFRKVNIKNCPHFFFSDMTNIKNFGRRLLGRNKMSFKSTDSILYYIEYIKSLAGENSLYFVFNNVDAYIGCNSTEESNENKYLTFTSTDKNKETLENYTELLDGIKDQFETLGSNKPIEYKKDFMKIKFESDDDLPLCKMSSIPACIIVVRPVFQEGNNYYPHVYLHECLYEFEHNYEHED